MHYDCISYKSFYESPRRLGDCEEAMGKLIRIFEAEGHTVAAFEWGAISLPLDLREELESLAGREIAILRLGGRYYLREVVAGA
ncbi:MAG: hypothetical protein ACOX7O_05470 [Oscillospiraceae bacterium]|jgi:hypothetical protein